MQHDPIIPRTEYARRWTQVQTMMRDTNIDVLIVYSNDREVFGQAHMRWICDFPVHLEPVCAVFSRTGSPVLATGPESTDFIRHRSAIQDAYILEDFIHPEEVYHLDNIMNLKSVVEQVTSVTPELRVGVAGRHIMDIATWEAIQTFLGTRAWVDVDDQFTKLRMVKSPAEVAVMRFGYGIAQKAFEAAVSAIEPGKTEMEIAAVVKSVMFQEGADGFGIEPMIGAGPNAASVLCRSSRQRIERDDIVRLAIITRYEGYCATIGRPVFVGNIDPAMKDRVDILIEARAACIRAAQAGVRGEAIEGAGRRVLAENGYQYTYSGVHSIGCQEFETPIFGPGVEGTVVENTMLSVEIPLFHQPWGGLHLEDGIRITNAGPELMHESQLFIQK
ncbi:MAG: Xaa-Pro peptidase family protein [Alkalispirochaeta sp.]